MNDKPLLYKILEFYRQITLICGMFFLTEKVVKKSVKPLYIKGFDANGTKTFPKENQSNDERNEQATNEISAKRHSLRVSFLFDMDRV
ncbi:hypothetical protein PDJ86_21970 [Bacillus cereus group sp. TH36-2LC]|nr:MULTISPECIES: hypothetical protein [Bacillus cereus group]MDA1509528.1 hypothetical protein [Bacillus cereus group sp. TH36-2LC]CKE95491.1 Uncharacterised protein [Bacillus paranthracis]